MGKNYETRVEEFQEELEALKRIKERVITDKELMHIYLEIAGGRGNHGGFLVAFAQAYIRADDQNLFILRSAAVTLAAKYHLVDYLDNYERVMS
jgi:hypothetical protein